MEISHWLIALAVFAIIIAAFARSFGEIRLQQTSGLMGAEQPQPYVPGVTEAQPPGMVSEDQQDLKELLDARTNAQDQLDILVTGRNGGGPAAVQLRTVLEEIDKRIAELRSERA